MCMEQPTTFQMLRYPTSLPDNNPEWNLFNLHHREGHREVILNYLFLILKLHVPHAIQNAHYLKRLN